MVVPGKAVKMAADVIHVQLQKAGSVYAGSDVATFYILGYKEETDGGFHCFPDYCFLCVYPFNHEQNILLAHFRSLVCHSDPFAFSVQTP